MRALSEQERVALADAVQRHTGYPAPRGSHDLSSVLNPVERVVADMLAVGEAPVERVRALHAPAPDEIDEMWCLHCSRLGGGVHWPCPTISALTGYSTERVES